MQKLSQEPWVVVCKHHKVETVDLREPYIFFDAQIKISPHRFKNSIHLHQPGEVGNGSIPNILFILRSCATPWELEHEMDPALDIRWSWRGYVLSKNGWLRSQRKCEGIKGLANPAPWKNRSNKLWSQDCSPRELTSQAGWKTNEFTVRDTMHEIETGAVQSIMTLPGRYLNERSSHSLLSNSIASNANVSPTTPSGAPDSSLCVTLVHYEKLSPNNG